MHKLQIQYTKQSIMFAQIKKLKCIGGKIYIHQWLLSTHICITKKHYSPFYRTYKPTYLRQPVTKSETHMQNILVGNVNIIPGRFIAKSSIQYSHLRSTGRNIICSSISSPMCPLFLANLFIGWINLNHFIIKSVMYKDFERKLLHSS